MAIPNTPPSGSPMGGGPPPGAMGPPPGGPPPGAMAGPPGPPGGAEGGVTVEDLLEALKQLPPPMLQMVVDELVKFMGPEGAEEGPPEDMLEGGPPPPGPGGPGGPGGAPPEMLRGAAQARASMGAMGA